LDPPASKEPYVVGAAAVEVGSCWKSAIEVEVGSAHEAALEVVAIGVAMVAAAIMTVGLVADDAEEVAKSVPAGQSRVVGEPHPPLPQGRSGGEEGVHPPDDEGRSRTEAVTGTEPKGATLVNHSLGWQCPVELPHDPPLA
jgi:hypothetical protein